MYPSWEYQTIPSWRLTKAFFVVPYRFPSWIQKVGGHSGPLIHPFIEAQYGLPLWFPSWIQRQGAIPAPQGPPPCRSLINPFWIP